MKTGQLFRIFAVLVALNLPGSVTLRAQNEQGTSTNPPVEELEVGTNTQWIANTNGGAPASITIRNPSGGSRDAMVVFGHNAELKAGESVEAVVVIGGSAKIHGKVRDAAVVVFGELELCDGAEVGDAAVAVMGGINVRSNAVVKGEVVAVGGKVNLDPGAKVTGQTQEVDLGMSGLNLGWLQKWVTQCVFKMRPLAPQVGWVWWFAGLFFLLYLLIAAAFQRPVKACVAELQNRPATTFLLGLLTNVLLPVIFLLLTLTGIGLLAIPFLIAGFVLAAMVGKVALQQALGETITTKFGSGVPAAPLVNFLLGTVLILMLYMIPVLGLMTFAITSMWGLGAATAAAFAGLKRELPRRPNGAGSPPVVPPPMASATTPGMAPAPISTLAATASTAPVTGVEGEAPLADPTQVPPITEPGPAPTPTPLYTSTPPAAPPPVQNALAHPKASFWERMGAGFLDMVLVGILSGLVGGPPLSFLVALAYFAGMWAWQGTTIGGIVLGLKVVRVDNQPICFKVAMVRALASAFSMVVFFIGFFCIIWDRDQQGWHDRIAGTYVIRLPKGTPLVCV